MNIRVFNFDSDYEKVLELWRNAGPGVQLSPSDEPGEILKKLKRDPDLFLVAELNGAIVGAVLGGFDGRRGLVYHLAVVSEYRRSSFGIQLMEELEKRLREKGCYKYYLLVSEDNLIAREFYESLGCEMMDMRLMGKVLG
ncbi:MAG: GNAT family N-acetyltransferase [Anaerolineales bacterium]|nr:GNAT family N-acetyltransferase [Anaerolineales bacterium]